MEHSVKQILIPRSWRLRMWNYGYQHPPKLKLRLGESGVVWNVYPLAGTLCTAYYSSRLYFWKVGSYLRFGRWGVFVFHPSVLGGCWTEQPSPECSCYLFKFPTRIFARIFQKRFRFPNGTLESLKVYNPHLWPRYLTMLFLSLQLICGVYG